MHEFTRALEPRHYAISSLNPRRAGSGSNGVFNLGCFVDQFAAEAFAFAAAEASWIADQLAGSREELLRGTRKSTISPWRSVHRSHAMEEGADVLRTGCRRYNHSRSRTELLRQLRMTVVMATMALLITLSNIKLNMSRKARVRKLGSSILLDRLIRLRWLACCAYTSSAAWFLMGEMMGPFLLMLTSFALNETLEDLLKSKYGERC